MDTNKIVLNDFQNFRLEGISAEPAALLTLAVAIRDHSFSSSHAELLGHEFAKAMKNVLECPVVRVEASVSND